MCKIDNVLHSPGRVVCSSLSAQSLDRFADAVNSAPQSILGGTGANTGYSHISFRVDLDDAGPGRLPSATVWAISDEDGSELGQCEFNACNWADHPQADSSCQDWFFVTHMGVPPIFTDEHQFQGKGVGLLLLGEALRCMREIGYRHSCISTDRGNNRALLFYSNVGYETVEWTHSYTLASLDDVDERKPVLQASSWTVQGEHATCSSFVQCSYAG